MTTALTPVRRRRSEATRQRILEAAAQCFVALGFRRTRFEDISGRAGVSRSLVYAYFENKEELLRSVRDDALEGWRAAVEPEIERSDGACAKLESTIRHTLLYARAHPLLQAILTEDGRLVVLGSDGVSRAAIDQWCERLARILRAGVEAGELRSDLDVQHTADVLRAMQLGIIDRMHRNEGPIRVGQAAHIDAAVTLIMEGLRR